MHPCPSARVHYLPLPQVATTDKELLYMGTGY